VRPISSILEQFQRKSLLALLLICFGLMITSVPGVHAQTLTGTAPTINIATAVAGSEPTPVTNTGSNVKYSGKTFLSKITVKTVCANQKFDLSVVAGSITAGRGTAAAAVVLLNGMLDTDFIVSIPANVGSTTVSLRYTAAPQFSDGTGTDTHTVTYTQVAN
jgi:hypothetical protein